jgi:hypothetical protein
MGRLNPDPGRCDYFSSAGSSKIKIRTSSWHKSQLALFRDEVRILIFEIFCDRCVTYTHKFPSSLLPNYTVV